MERKLRSQVTGWENAQNREKNKTIEGYFLGEQVSPPIFSDEEEQGILSEEVKASASRASKGNLNWAQATEDLKKQVSSLLKENQKNAEENNILKRG